jgi:hypothetical protein
MLTRHRSVPRAGVRARGLAAALILVASSTSVASAQEPPAAPPTAPPAAAPGTEAKRGLVVRSEGAFEGYTLFAPLQSTTTYLVDMDGRVVHRWESTLPPGNSAYLLDDGRLLRTARESNERMGGGGQGGRIQEFSWSGELLWDHAINSPELLSHHDIEPLPNGNVLVIAWQYTTRDEALALGRDPAVVGEAGFWPDVVLELEPVRPSGARIVWQWRSVDHLVQDRDPALPNHGDVPAHVGRIDVNADHRSDRPRTAEERERDARQLEQMKALGYVDTSLAGNADGDRTRDGGDWLHTNSIDYHAELDLVLLSVRTLGELWVVDHSTTTEEARGSSGGRHGRGGDILWRWGNPRVHGLGDRGDQRLFGQHDAQWIDGEPVPGRDGERDLRILVFNNGNGRPAGPHATVEELVLPYDREHGFLRDEGEPFGPDAPIWIHGEAEGQRFEADFISGAQRLPGGTTLVCQGPTGRLFEVDRSGAVVWEYVNPFQGDPRLRGGGGPRARGPRGNGGRAAGGPPAGGPPGGAPPAGNPPGDSPPGATPPGASPPGAGGDGPRDGAPPGRAGGARGGPGGMDGSALFRGTRYAKDHPAFAGRELAPLPEPGPAAPAAPPPGDARAPG